MEVVKRHKFDIMLNIVKCPDCGKLEYYGMLHWHNGHEFCRQCIYRIWSEESDFRWKPTEKDKVFPIYVDGINHSNEDANYIS